MLPLRMLPNHTLRWSTAHARVARREARISTPELGITFWRIVRYTKNELPTVATSHFDFFCSRKMARVVRYTKNELPTVATSHFDSFETIARTSWHSHGATVVHAEWNRSTVLCSYNLAGKWTNRTPLQKKRSDSETLSLLRFWLRIVSFASLKISSLKNATLRTLRPRLLKTRLIICRNPWSFRNDSANVRRKTEPETKESRVLRKFYVFRSRGCFEGWTSISQGWLRGSGRLNTLTHVRGEGRGRAVGQRALPLPRGPKRLRSDHTFPVATVNLGSKSSLLQR